MNGWYIAMHKKSDRLLDLKCYLDSKLDFIHWVDKFFLETYWLIGNQLGLPTGARIGAWGANKFYKFKYPLISLVTGSE